MSDASRQRAATILIAEDSMVVRALVRRHLEDHGYRVIEAEDGAAALRACGAERPDAALLDIEMPVMDGHQVLAELKANPELSDIPVVFLTGRTTTEDIVAGLRLGANDYLRKPFEPAELIARVSAAVRVKFLQDELRARNVELDAASRSDALTGLHNRRHAVEHLVQHASSARRHGLQLSVVMFDVDHFKAVNDRFGHAGGDAVLREFALRLGPILRAGDLAARWGGEEFLLVLPSTDATGALDLGERVRVVVAAQPFPAGAGELCPVTISGGVATSRGEDAEELVRRADEALYVAKEGGRDRLAVAP